MNTEITELEKEYGADWSSKFCLNLTDVLSEGTKHMLCVEYVTEIRNFEYSKNHTWHNKSEFPKIFANRLENIGYMFVMYSTYSYFKPIGEFFPSDEVFLKCFDYNWLHKATIYKTWLRKRFLNAATVDENV